MDDDKKKHVKNPRSPALQVLLLARQERQSLDEGDFDSAVGRAVNELVAKRHPTGLDSIANFLTSAHYLFCNK